MRRRKWLILSLLGFGLLAGAYLFSRPPTLLDRSRHVASTAGWAPTYRYEWLPSGQLLAVHFDAQETVLGFAPGGAAGLVPATVPKPFSELGMQLGGIVGSSAEGDRWAVGLVPAKEIPFESGRQASD